MFIEEKILMCNNMVVDYLFNMFIYVYKYYFEVDNLCSI